MKHTNKQKEYAALIELMTNISGHVDKPFVDLTASLVLSQHLADRFPIDLMMTSQRNIIVNGAFFSAN